MYSRSKQFRTRESVYFYFYIVGRELIFSNNFSVEICKQKRIQSPNPASTTVCIFSDTATSAAIVWLHKICLSPPMSFWTCRSLRYFPYFLSSSQDMQTGLKRTPNHLDTNCTSELDRSPPHFRLFTSFRLSFITLLKMLALGDSSRHILHGLKMVPSQDFQLGRRPLSIIPDRPRRRRA